MLHEKKRVNERETLPEGLTQSRKKIKKFKKGETRTSSVTPHYLIISRKIDFNTN